MRCAGGPLTSERTPNAIVPNTAYVASVDSPIRYSQTKNPTHAATVTRRALRSATSPGSCLVSQPRAVRTAVTAASDVAADPERTSSCGQARVGRKNQRMTDPEIVAGQAIAVADAWSPPDAPASWWLTAATFTAIAREPVLRDLAAAIPPDRLPPLLLAAVLRHLVAVEPDAPIARHYPVPGGPQPPLDPGFGAELAAFAAARRDRVAELAGRHRYQMNEVGRCVDVLPVLGRIAAAERRPLALVDLGTGAGLGLHLDRYHYAYRTSDGVRAVGDPAAAVRLSCAVRAGEPPVPPTVPVLADRVGIDVEPLDLADPATLAWLTACVPPEAGAVTRFAAASALARAHPARAVRGSLLDALPAVVADLPP